MRDFFKHELERLHLTTGLQQYAKLSDAEFTDLLDLLCAKCTHFPLIPDKDKQEYIREFMMSDPDFLGFNPKILGKWLNSVNRAYVVTQSDRQESVTVAPPYAEYVKMCEAISIEPASEDDYDKPIKPENIEKHVEHLRKSIGSMDISEDVARNRANRVEEMQKNFGVPEEKRQEIEKARKKVCQHTETMYWSETEVRCNNCGKTIPALTPKP